MPSLRQIPIALVLTLCALSAAPHCLEAQEVKKVNDAIIAVVNSDVITLKDLHEYVAAMSMQLSSEGKTETEIKEIMSQYISDGLNRLIDDRLLVDEANKKGLIIRPKLVDDKISQIKKQYPTEREFLASLASEGLTVSDLKKKITDQLKARYIIEGEIKSKIFVTPQEVTEYYQGHANEFKKPERVDLLSVFIPYTDSDRATARHKADEALGRIKNNEDFDAVAKNYSSAPSIGVIEKGQILPAIENIVFNLKEGEVSAPVETDTGIYIFKLKAKYPQEQAALDEVKGYIDSTLSLQKFRTRLTQWLEELRKKAYVEIKQ